LLSEQAERLDDLAMLIIDPLVTAVAGDSHKNAEVRRALAPLVTLAQELNVATVGITLYAKASNGRDPLERVIGSIAFGALARIVLGTARQEQDDEASPRRFTLARAKSNIGPDGRGFAYGLEVVDLEGSDIAATRIAWHGAVEGTARELLAESEPDTEAGQDAASFLRELLTGGPPAARAVFKQARDAGFNDRAMQRARLRIAAVTVKDGMSGGWVWKLSEDATTSEDAAEGAEDAVDANFRKVSPSASSVSRSGEMTPPKSVATPEA
jgi:hypothetical protein